MKAAHFLGNELIEIHQAATPALAEGEVLLQVAFCGLCGSDKRPYREGFPLIPGHEVSGTVVDANGTNIPIGTRAAAYLSVFCGDCDYCARGLTNNCLRRKGLLGWSEPWNGGYAEYMAVPACDILPLDDSVSFQAGVLLLDTIGTSWHALRLANVQASSRVLVIGCGPLGLGAIAGAVAFGASEVFACDLVDYRREAAADLGAVALTPEEMSTIEGIDVIIEAAGTPATLMQAIRLVAPLGRVVMLGEIWKPWTFEPDLDTMLKDYSLIRSWYFPLSEFAENQQYVIDKKVDVDKLISHTMKLDDLQAAFQLFFSGKTRKVLSAS
ncbi:MAG: zinc-dependent alcohol dehydrogenase [Thermomicrobiales bacterium]